MGLSHLFNPPPRPALEDILDYDYIPVPPGFRVKSVEVIEDAGIESLRVRLEAIPTPPTVTLLSAEVVR